MNIAIFHGVLDMHCEVLGYLIDYFCKIKNNSIKVNYYFNPDDNEKIEWLKVYNNIFNININCLNIHNFNPDNYDLIFLVTDDDYCFKNEWFVTHKSKIISINHTSSNRHNYKVLLDLHLRYINTRPDNIWTMSCYQGINKVDKLKLISNSKKIKIVCVGKIIPPSAIYFKNIFENADEIEINIIARSKHDNIITDFDFNKYIKNNYYPMIRINVYIDMKTSDMINLIKESSYIFCCKIIELFPDSIEKIKNYERDNIILSGIIPIGLSFGCQLILPSSWEHTYKLKSVIYYNENVSYKEIINCQKIKINHHTKQSLDILYNNLYELINSKNLLFDNILKLKDNIFIYNTNNTCWFSNICHDINIPKPNIFIETGTYLGHGIINVKNDFREVHSIELNEKFYNDALINFKDDSNVFMHLGDSAEVMDEIIHNINEPILFYLDAHFSGGETAFGKEEDKGCPLLRELNVLGKRKYNDIIIVDDMRLMNKASYSGIENDKIYPLTYFDFRHVTEDSIKLSYNRPAHYYNARDFDRLIIVPIKN